jgi:outer membrane protein OmpA-like peptidoglycan-associated protein
MTMTVQQIVPLSGAPLSGTSRRRFVALAAAIGLTVSGCAVSPPPPERHALFFAPDSAALDQPAQDLIARLAAEIRAKPVREIILESFANRAPDGSQNRVLADQRAETITRALEAQGVDPKLVRSIVVGQAERIGLSALEGRRVDITIQR